jgi:hypothetical protein
MRKECRFYASKRRFSIVSMGLNRRHCPPWRHGEHRGPEEPPSDYSSGCVASMMSKGSSWRLNIITVRRVRTILEAPRCYSTSSEPLQLNWFLATIGSITKHSDNPA